MPRPVAATDRMTMLSGSIRTGSFTERDSLKSSWQRSHISHDLAPRQTISGVRFKFHQRFACGASSPTFFHSH